MPGFVKYGIVKKDPSIEQNRDGTKNVVMLQCEIEDPEDIQQVEFRFSPGQTAIPQKEDEILIIPISDSWLIGISSNDGIPPAGNPGDRKYYSAYKQDDDSDTIMQAFLELLATGKFTIQAADGSDPAVMLGSIVGNPDGSMSLKSTDTSGADQATIDLKNDGNLELNGTGDFAVRYNELKTAFDQLKSDYDAHVHSGVTAGAGSTGTTTASTADMTPAKIDTVKLPS